MEAQHQPLLYQPRGQSCGLQLPEQDGDGCAGPRDPAEPVAPPSLMPAQPPVATRGKSATAGLHTQGYVFPPALLPHLGRFPNRNEEMLSFATAFVDMSLKHPGEGGG